MQIGYMSSLEPHGSLPSTEAAFEYIISGPSNSDTTSSSHFSIEQQTLLANNCHWVPENCLGTP